MVERKTVIINTDPGYDDAMALMLALKSKELEVLAVTTTAGNSTIENTTRNAQYILSLLNAEHVSLFSGAEKPLERDLDVAKVTGKSGLEGIDPSNEPILTGDAVDQLLSLVERRPYEITLLSLGPLTNIAQAILRAPEIMAQVKELVAMGGALRVPGNKNRVAEYNIFVDPEAADVVLKSALKTTLVPLDACNQVWMGIDHFQQIVDAQLRGFLLTMANHYMRNIATKAGEKKALMYDPLTVYYLLNPAACSVEELDVVIETKGDVTRGMTVADLRANARTNPNVKVVSSIDPDHFISDFIRVVNS